MAQRRQIRERRSLEGGGERPATGYGEPGAGAGAKRAGQAGRLSYVRTTRRRSQRPQSVISTFPIHTAGGGSTPAFTREIPSMNTG